MPLYYEEVQMLFHICSHNLRMRCTSDMEILVIVYLATGISVSVT